MNQLDSSNILLEMSGIEKSFPGVYALRNVALDLQAGEVLALLGENGAGKSTLIKVLSGAYLPDSGTIKIHQKSVSISEPVAAQKAGVAVIYQEFNLIPSLTARENIFLGRENTSGGFVKKRDEYQQAVKLFERVGVEIDPEALCGELTVAQQQIVEIAKALSTNAEIIVMDEPSATLTDQEVEKLFKIIRELKSQGIGVIYISHRLDEIFEIADRIMVMRDGSRVALRNANELTRNELIELMVGRKIENEFPKQKSKLGPVRLQVHNLNRSAAVKDVSFELRGGEVLALTGLVGSGRTEVARLIFGADRMDSGWVELDGRAVEIKSPADAIGNGICLLTEDRKAEGLVLNHSVKHNFALPNLPELSGVGFVKTQKEQQRFTHYVNALRIKIPDQDELAMNLSGGNQQKVVLAKWLERNSDIIIFDEPTRGIDVGAKYEIYLLMNELASRGKAILMISSELPEVLGMSDRVLVMHEGRITGEITDVDSATQQDIMKLAIA